MIDLHMHTVYSDGSSTPEELVEAVYAQGMKAIAVTDHDTTESLKYVQKAAEGKDLLIIPGIEINTVWEGREVHVLGYYIDPENELLQEVCNRHASARVEQMHAFADSLSRKGKVRITVEDILAEASDTGVVGRPHVAKALVKKGQVRDISEAFDKYLSRHCHTHVKRETVTPHEAVEAIYESGGIPVIAHPKDMEEIERLVEELMDYGLRGLEAYHRSHSPVLIEFHCSLAEEYGLCVTGGTDFHGTPEMYERALSRLHVPKYVMKQLLEEKRNRALSMFRAS